MSGLGGWVIMTGESGSWFEGRGAHLAPFHPSISYASMWCCSLRMVDSCVLILVLHTPYCEGGDGGTAEVRCVVVTRYVRSDVASVQVECEDRGRGRRVRSAAMYPSLKTRDVRRTLFTGSSTFAFPFLPRPFPVAFLDLPADPSRSREPADAPLPSFFFFSAGSGLNGFLATLTRFPKPAPEFLEAFRGGVRPGILVLI